MEAIYCFHANAGGSECQASNVTANVQNDSQSFMPLINSTVDHAVLKFSPCQQAAAVTRAYCGLVLDIGLHASASCSRCNSQPGLGHKCWQATCRDWWTGVSHSAEARLCHERDVLAHCLARRQTRPQWCVSLAAALTAATRVDSTVQVTVSKQLHCDSCSFVRCHAYICSKSAFHE